MLVRDMLDHAAEAAELVRGRTREELRANRLLSLSLTRLLEIVEAASRVPSEQAERYPGIPWRDIVGLRNRLIHGYATVDMDVLWKIATADLPELVDALKRIVESEGER